MELLGVIREFYAKICYNFLYKCIINGEIMTKKERHNKIRHLIKSGRIGTQEEIKRQLLEDGISVTQATLSRD